MKKFASASTVLFLIIGFVLALGLKNVSAENGENESENQNFTFNASSSVSGGGDDQFKDFEEKLNEGFDEFRNAAANAPIPSSLTIGPNGNIRITGGEVKAVSGNSLTVGVWGLNLNVDISGATFIGNLPLLDNSSTTASSTGSQVNVGDKVLIAGTIDPSTTVIKAQWVRDLSRQSQNIDAIKSRIKQLLDLLRSLQEQFQLKVKGFGNAFEGGGGSE